MMDVAIRVAVACLSPTASALAPWPVWGAEPPIAAISIDLAGKVGVGAPVPGGIADIVDRWCALPAMIEADDASGLIGTIRQVVWRCAADQLRADVLVFDVSVVRDPGGPKLAGAGAVLAIALGGHDQVDVERSIRNAIRRVIGAAGEGKDLKAGLIADSGGQSPVHVECRLSEGTLVLAFGPDGLQRYDAWRIAAPPLEPACVFGADFNLNQFRVYAGEALEDHDPAARLLTALGVANARRLQLRVSTAVAPGGGRPALLALDCNIEARSDTPGSMRSVRLSETTWPADLKSFPGARAALVIRADPLGPGPPATGGGWAGWLRGAVAAANACMPAVAEERATVAARAWQSRRGEAARSATASMGRWAVVLFGSAGAGAGQAVVFTPLKNSRDAAERALRQVLAEFTPAYVRDSGHEWQLNRTASALCNGLSFGVVGMPGGAAMAAVVQVAGPDATASGLTGVMGTLPSPAR